MKQKGFTYIIIVVFIMIFVTMLFLISKNVNYSKNKIKDILSNYKNEIKYLSQNSLIDVNSLDEFNKSFKEFIKSNNYKSKACNIYFDGNKYVISNYLDENFSVIENYQTIEILGNNISQDINFGECFMDISKEKSLAYYIEIYSDSEKSVYKQ